MSIRWAHNGGAYCAEHTGTACAVAALVRPGETGASWIAETWIQGRKHGSRYASAHTGKNPLHAAKDAAARRMKAISDGADPLRWARGGARTSTGRPYRTVTVVVSARVTPDVRDRVASAAEAAGLSVPAYLGRELSERYP